MVDSRVAEERPKKRAVGRLWLPRIFLDGGAEGIRTPDPHNAIVVLYQLSYDPVQSAGNLVGRLVLSKHFAG